MLALLPTLSSPLINYLPLPPTADSPPSPSPAYSPSSPPSCLVTFLPFPTAHLPTPPPRPCLLTLSFESCLSPNNSASAIRFGSDEKLRTTSIYKEITKQTMSVCQSGVSTLRWNNVSDSTARNKSVKNLCTKTLFTL